MKNAVAKLLFAIFIAPIFIADAAAQTNCDWSAETAPLLLDLPIGASPEKVQTVLGKALKIKIKKNGERTVFQNYIKKPAPDRLRGVRALYLRFFDRRLYQIEIFYEPRLDLPTLEAATDALAAQLDFSVADWETKNNRARIECGEISLVADYVLNLRVELTDEIVRARIEELREKEEK